MTALEDAWDFQKSWAERDNEYALCMMDLRRRVEALEQRAAAPEPEPAPAADRPLWVVMKDAFTKIERPLPHQLAAEIDAVASWLEQRYLDRYPGAAELLRIEARRAREGA